MKKVVAFGLVAAMGVTVAFASSVGVPWFVDNSPKASGIPPTSGVTTLITLKNNRDFDLLCSIVYFSATGVEHMPTPKNTFIIPANSAVQFRPAIQDPSAQTTVDMDGNPVPGQTGGLESTVGVSVPIHPSGSNGSATISWDGDPTDLQGSVTTVQTFPAGGQQNRLNNNQPLIISYAHLLPPGA